MFLLETSRDFLLAVAALTLPVTFSGSVSDFCRDLGNHFASAPFGTSVFLSCSVHECSQAAPIDSNEYK